MTTQSCPGVREELAVALLRGEPLTDELRAHQDSCPACREEFARLAVLPALLDATRDESVPPVEVPDEALLHRTLGELARRRSRRQRAAIGGILLAAAAVAAVGVAAGPDGLTRPASNRVADQPKGVLVASGTAQSDTSDAGADIDVLSAGPAEGSVIVVSGWGIPDGSICRIELTDSGGWTHAIKTWTPPDGKPTSWQARIPVSVAPREVRAISLVDDATNRPFVTIRVRPT